MKKSTVSDAGGDSLERLRVFTRRIMAVPKKELDAKLAEHQRRKRKKLAGGHGKPPDRAGRPAHTVNH